MDESRIVKQHYDEHALDEWNRLEGFHFEFEITMAMFARHWKKGRILDLGGGPGRYSIALAKSGNDLTLVDLSDGNVALAKAKAAEAGVSIRALAGDARDLSQLGDERFDAILIMGPMYHLFQVEDRRKVLDEAKRHLAIGGKIFVSFIVLSGGFNYYLSENPAAMKDDPATDFFDCAANDTTWTGDAFTAATFVDPDEIRPFFEQSGWNVLTVFGQEGITGPRLSDLEKADADVRDFYLQLSLRLCEKPKYHAYSSHLMAVATPR
jgi:2-polyprenyl-3-methyl-5-hydroxy-6-metoxy-1,4-benzoquinol methylase